MKQIVLILSGFIPLLGLTATPPTTVLLIYTIFVIIYFLRKPLQVIVHALDMKTSITFFLITELVSLGFLEFFSWLNEYLANNPEPALLHPQLIPDLILGFGFYFGWVVAWYILFKKFKFSLKQTFITHGIVGLLVEKQGGIFLAGLFMMPFGLLVWLFVFLAYGSAMGIVYLLIGQKLNEQAKQDIKWKYVWAFFVLLISTLLCSLVWGGLLNGLHLLPPPRPISIQPF